MPSSAERGLFQRPLQHPNKQTLAALVGDMANSGSVAQSRSSNDPGGLGKELGSLAMQSERFGLAAPTVWPAARLALTNQLWGAGFVFPGGETETLRLSRPFDISARANMLLVGVGAGGPAIAVTRNLGVWVTGLSHDASLLAAARGLISRSHLTKKVSIKVWNPDHPVLGGGTHDYCLALEPFLGAQPEPILDSLTQALKPGGHLVITELTAPAPLNPADATVRRWGELENRDPASLLAPVAVTRMMGRVGLDVRLIEDISQRHLEHAMLGWRVLLRGMDHKPKRQDAVHLIHEAELWLLRRRLIRDGRLRMMRWHAISHTGSG
jgi:SAM-dependent methyltransferase